MLAYMLKRDLQLFVRCLVAALVFALFLGVIAYGAVTAVSRGGTERAQLPEIAVVDKENSMLSRMLIGFVENSEFAAPLFRVTKAKEKEAMRRFAEGSCSAVIVLPENFLEDISYGREAGGQIYLSETVGTYANVVASAAKFGEKMLAAGQYGVFSGEHLLRDYGRTNEEHEQYLMAVNAKLLNEVLESNTNYYEIVLTDYDNTSLDVVSDYLTAWLAFVLVLGGLFFHKLYKMDLNASVYARLAAYGVSAGIFSAGKIGFPFVFQTCLSVVVVLLTKGYCKITLTPGSVCALFLALLLASFLAFAFAVCMKNEVILTTAVAFVGLLLCGGVIPRPTLPAFCRIIGDLSPLGAVRTLVSPMFGAGVDIRAVLVAVGYLLLFVWMIGRGLNRLKTGKGKAEG